REVEAAALTENALGPDAAAVRLDDSAADGEAEARSALLPRRRVLDLGELPEDPLEILRGNPLALIGDDQLVLPGVGLELDRDLPARLRELDRVRAQVLEHLLDPMRVGEHHRWLARQAGVHLDPLSAGELRHPEEALLDQVVERGRRELDAEHPRLDLR